MAFTSTSKVTRTARTIALAVTGGLLLGLGAVAAPATAAETKPSVTIKKIKSKTAKYGKKVTVKPSVKKAGKVKISSKLLTVKQGKKTIAKNKKSVKLKAGTYKVTTTVKYKVGTVKKTTTKYWAAGSSNYLSSDTDVTCTISKWTEDDYWEEYEWESVCTDAAGAKYLTTGNEWYEDEAWVTSTSPSKYAVGGTWTGTLEGDQYVYGAVQKNKTTSKTVYGKTKTKKYTQTLVIKQGKKPTSTSPNGWNCPSGYPIKGNQSGIYHVPGGAYYSRTNPEECFATEAAAKAAGYRKSKR